MPELPEVQTIVSDLTKKIIGRRIIDVWFDAPKIIKSPKPPELKKQIKNFKITDVQRRGKNILIYLLDSRFRGNDKQVRHPEPHSLRSVQAPANDLDTKREEILRCAQNDTTLDSRFRGNDKKHGNDNADNSFILLIHQKMTGHLLYGKWRVNKTATSQLQGALQEKVNNYIHFIIYLDNGWQVGLSDLRKFAKIVFGPKDKIENLEEIKKLGPDPLLKNFTFRKFSKIIIKKGKIKQILMDQNIIAGIGNIYADEILWFAKIHPLKSANSLSESELKKIYQAMREILKKAIQLRGTSISDFRDTNGQLGKYGNIRKVYRRTGAPCPRCRTAIKRIKLGGRSAHYCPKCQIL